MECKTYRKTTPTMARVLTEQDYESYQGVIQTHEGPVTFLPGDYLAKDQLGVWPMRVECVRHGYERGGMVDSEGFIALRSKEIRQAAQMHAPFVVNGLAGKTGDYLVFGQASAWPVDREAFENSYTLVEQ